MSYILDPPVLFLLGMMGYYIWKRLHGVISDYWREFVVIMFGAFFCFIAFMIGSTTLYIDWWDWPIPFTEGPVWMFHTDITGIAIGDVEVWIAVVMLFLYPVWYLLGYRAARAFDEGIFLLPEVSYEDVQSKSEKPETKVVVKRGGSSQDLVKSALQELGGLESFVKAGQRVLIKPNISGGNPTIRGSFTSIEVVDTLVTMIRELGAEPVVVDSDMIWTKMQPVAKQQGWIDWARKNDVVLLNLAETEWVRFDFGKDSKIGKVPVSRELVEADVIISVPTMKTHLLTNITIAMKNMYGTFPQENKGKYHRFGIEEVIYSVNKAFTPNLTIIDGTIGGEAWGPLSCRPLDFGTIIASNDVVAADSVASQLMGYDPKDVLHIKMAAERGLGNIVEYDMSTLTPHEKDGKWLRPEPLVSYFYEGLCELVLLIPTMQIFFDLAADVVLYDFATLPGLKKLNWSQLGVLNDIIGGVLRGGFELSKLGQKRIHDLTEAVTNWENTVTDGKREDLPDRPPRMVTKKDEWPSEDLANVVEELRNEFSGKDDTIRLGTPHKILSFNDSSVTDQLEEFAPDVKLIGLGLWNEKNPIISRLLGKRGESLRPWKHEYWGGILTRVLEKKDNAKMRCLQYIYVYTRQRGTVSTFWMVVLPWLMFLWSFYLRFLFFQENLTSNIVIQFLAFFVAPLPVLLMTLRIHAEDIARNPKGQQLVFRSTTLVIIFYPLMAFSWLWDVLSLSLLIIGGIFAFIWLLEYVCILPTSHAMDYEPVFIWIEKISDSEKKRMGEKNVARFVGKDNWAIKYVVWDIFHYYCQPIHRNILKDYTQSKRVLLEIPDTWHAMELEKVAGVTGTFKRWIFPIGIAGCILSAILGVLLRYNVFPFLSQFLNDYGLFEISRSVFLPFIFIISGLFIVRGRFKLVDSQDQYGKITAELTKSKLLDLWNMDEEPRLKVITKLQYPFTAFEFRKDKLQTFHDEVFFLFNLVSRKERRDS